MTNQIRSFISTGLVLFVLLGSCAPVKGSEQPINPKPITVIAPVESTGPAPEPAIEATMPPTSVPQPTLPPTTYGPNQADFPEDVNPFTGLQVADPPLLEQPALLVSITHFPPEVRPQGGLSFAPWVFEFYITEGATRFSFFSMAS